MRSRAGFYTQSHIDYVADAVARIGRDRDRLRGYRITSAPPVLRHFTARFEPAAPRAYTEKAR